MGTTNAFTQFSPAELFHRMDQKEAVHLIHVVTKDHFNKAHIPSANNACVFEVTDRPGFSNTSGCTWSSI